jgi:hypothetical protein
MADAEFEALVRSKEDIEARLLATEQQIQALETTYLEKTTDRGNVFRGWDAYLTPGAMRTKHQHHGGAGSSHRHGVGSSGASQRTAKHRDAERLFSLSSVTSPVSRAIEATAEGGPIAAAMPVAIAQSPQPPQHQQAAAAVARKKTGPRQKKPTTTQGDDEDGDT